MSILYAISFWVSKALKFAIWFVALAVSAVLFLGSFPILFVCEIYCLFIAITIFTTLYDQEEAKLRIGDKLLSISGIFLFVDTAQALKSVLWASKIRVRSKFRRHLSRFEKTKGSEVYSRSYDENGYAKSSIFYAVFYAIAAPSIAAALILVFVLPFWGISFIPIYLGVVLVLVVFPALYLFVIS